MILERGLATRYKSVVNDAPKCLDDIDGIPFLYLLLENLIKQELDDFFL